MKLAVALALVLASFGANADLQGRAPVTPGGTDYRAYYDTALDITWLANANLADTIAFGVTGIEIDGSMTWTKAYEWIAAMNAAAYLGKSDWRLPTVTDTGTSGCNFAYTGTDCGYNVNLASGEMAHLFYGTLSNTGDFNTSGIPTGCSGGPPYCLTNDGPLSNLQPSLYWSGTGYPPPFPGYAWVFNFGNGKQDFFDKTWNLFAWAVRPGDIGNVVAAPSTYCPAGVTTPDTDADGIPDLCDACILVSNADQSDSDHDGYGNRCDGDLNNSGLVTAADFNILRSRLNTTDPDADLNSSGLVTAADFNILRGMLNQPPGPSGRRGTPTAFQATPAAGYTKRVPIVLINFIPTVNGSQINDALWEGRPAYGYPWGQTLLISDIQAYISGLSSRVKFSLEEGSRFRGYKTPAAQPYLGYQVVAIYNFYDEMKPGQLYPGSSTGYLPDLHDILGRIPAQNLVEVQGVKEFWVNIHEMWGQGEIVFPESNMSSPTTGDISNSHLIADDLPVFAKTYVVYGTNYFRSQSEAVHNHGHQLEAMFTHVNWLQDANYVLFWDNFVGRSNGNFITGRCGWTHMPPNTTTGYDYYNPALVLSDCEDWRPDGTGQQTLVNASTWSNLVYNWPTPVPFGQQGETQFFIYWMQNMPGAGNTIPYGTTTMENWWDIVGDWDAAITTGKGLHR